MEIGKKQQLLEKNSEKRALFAKIGERVGAKVKKMVTFSNKKLPFFKNAQFCFSLYLFGMSTLSPALFYKSRGLVGLIHHLKKKKKEATL